MKASRIPFRFRRIQLLACLLASIVSQKTFAQVEADPFGAMVPKMQEFVDRGEISGVVTLIATPDRILHLAAVGKNDLSRERKLQTDDLFWIASMSKPITAVCIGILKDEGKLSFDDEVSKFIPEFKLSTPATQPSRPMTLRTLLTHTSGLGELNAREPHLTLQETATLIAKTPRKFAPGDAWSYSTAGIDTLGRIVEIVSGMPFDQFLQKRVFDPIGMKNTTFWIGPDDQQRFVVPYRWNAQTSHLEPTTIVYMYGTAITDRQRPPLGGAGLFSTAEDICRFYQMMLRKGEFDGKRILSPETVKEMTSKQTGNLTARPGMPWGLGFCIVEDPKAMEGNNTLIPGTFGHGGAFSTQSWADPTTQRIYVIMFERQGRGNPDNSDVRIAYQTVAAQVMSGTPTGR